MSESPLVGGGGGHYVTSGVQGAPCGCWSQSACDQPGAKGDGSCVWEFPSSSSLEAGGVCGHRCGDCILPLALHPGHWGSWASLCP